MTAHNPAMSFWPLERQLIDGTTPSDQDCREMLLEVRRLSAIERAASDDTMAALDRVRVAVRSRIRDMAASVGNLSHAMQIADAEYAERRAGE